MSFAHTPKLSALKFAKSKILPAFIDDFAKMPLRASIFASWYNIGRTAEKLEKVAEKINSESNVCMVKPCDDNDEVSTQRIADEILGEYGPCDLLVNGAGGNNVMAMTTYTQSGPH